MRDLGLSIGSRCCAELLGFPGLPPKHETGPKVVVQSTQPPPTAGEPLELNFLGSLERWLRLPAEPLDIVGSHSLLVVAAATLHHYLDFKKPHLVILASQDQVRAFNEALKFLDPLANPEHLPAFDVDVYSGLYPNRRIGAERIRWLFEAQNAKPGQIFVASLESLLQRTLPFQLLKECHFTLKRGADLPSDLLERLQDLGYAASPIVEDVGHFAWRGGVVDIFSPAHRQPIRLELFGDTIDSIRLFDPETQRSLETLDWAHIIPAGEILLNEERRQKAALRLKSSFQDRKVDQDEASAALHSLAHSQYLHGQEFLLSFFYDQPALPLDHFSDSIVIWQVDSLEVARQADRLFASLKTEFESNEHLLIRPLVHEVFAGIEHLEYPPDSHVAYLTKIQIEDASTVQHQNLSVSSSDLREFTAAAKALSTHTQELNRLLHDRLEEWRSDHLHVFITAATLSQCQRLRMILESADLKAEVVSTDLANWQTWRSEQDQNPRLVHLIPRHLNESVRLTSENIIFLRDEDLFGRKTHRRDQLKEKSIEIKTSALQFSDLKPGDLVVHVQHGVGIYEGLKVMTLQGAESELIQIKYKDNDRLYLPVFRIHQIHKFSGAGTHHTLDKLGGNSWEKTKTKVKNHLRDVAADLLQLYAQRSQYKRDALTIPDEDFYAFEAAFPYEETQDQLRAIQDILNDFSSEKPMDRLICGDVGFGKTEIALRAAFRMIQNRRQVAVIAPTTVLTFQHLETFRKRFKDWPVEIRSLNRFVPKAEVAATLKGLKDQSVDLVIGTHRLLSRDVQFKDLGLLIVDEEQKFGVQHKEKLRKLRAGIDTIAMSATPIPRTLNLSLMGIRDLSIINTPPADRLPTRTFVCKYDHDTIRKAVLSEIQRGGQIYFIHNRIESIYGLMDDLRSILPEVRMALAHGQMEAHELEKVMVKFFHHEIDMLVCTAIVESGMDVSLANTMFIDNAQQLGLSQLYQLRGRVGRSKERAYCYLLVPKNRKLDSDAQDRLKVLQENTALGSGIRVAQYDLELRGAGDILGEEQSGHIDAVGYEMYLELLEEAVSRLKGEDPEAGQIEPDINLRIPALIPDKYIPDIRMRLSFYRQLADIAEPNDMDRIEQDLRDQFGSPPEPVMNLMGLMLIRQVLKLLRVRDISSGKIGISLFFTESSPLPTEKVLELTSRSNKKYQITPDSRLSIRMNEISWPKIYEELQYLVRLCPRI